MVVLCDIFCLGGILTVFVTFSEDVVFLLDSSVSVSESEERETLLVTRLSSRGIVSADSFLSVTREQFLLLQFMFFST